MILSRRRFITATSGIVTGLGSLTISKGSQGSSRRGASALNFPSTNLHGYGRISAKFRSFNGGSASITHVICESKQKALLVQSKYLSDLERIPGVGSVGKSLNGTPHRATGLGGVVSCFARGRDVLIFAASNVHLHGQLVKSVFPIAPSSAEFRARTAVPMWLDRWDKFGLLAYFAPESTPSSGFSDQDYDYSDALNFARRNGPLGLIVWSNPLSDDHAEGITNEQSWAWVQENARKMGVPMHINTQISPPQVWLSNRYRDETMLRAPQFLGGYYGVASGSTTLGAISWVSEQAEDVLLGLFQHTVRRFAMDSNIVGWLEPHGETAETPQKYFLESGHKADSVMHEFLIQRYGTLKAVSQRWYGNPKHLRSWSDVQIPEIANFAGFDSNAIDLRGTWHVKYVTSDMSNDWSLPGFDDHDWDQFVAPGNDRMLTMPRNPMVYRRTVEIPAEWLKHDSPITLYVWDMVNHDGEPTVLFINGESIPEVAHLSNDSHWSHFDIRSAIKPGANSIVLKMPRAIICYRMYLTKVPPAVYPNLGQYKNAMWQDFVEWVIQSRGAQIRRGAEMIRQIDPDRSINFMAPGDYSEPVRQICQDYGGRFHDTGAMAGFWTEENTLMMTGAELPVTAEPGNGAPNPREFQMYWGRWITEGVNGVHYFMNLGEIMWKPEILNTFEANRKMYEMVGKYHSPFAQVAGLYSTSNLSLTGFPWSTNQNGYYSRFNSAGQLIDYCPRDGVVEQDFTTGRINKYKAVIDSNTSFMTRSFVSDIENYVRRGGLFITYGDTGRHTPVEPDSWPISQLTGFVFKRSFAWGEETLSLVPEQNIFTEVELPPKSPQSGQSLQPMKSDCRTIATWDDGSTAIGIRNIGKGWVVHMGPIFNGAQFVTMVGAILRKFGIEDRVLADYKTAPGLHFRHFIGNSGLHDIWVLFNESDNPVVTELNFAQGINPEHLTNVISGEKLAVVKSAQGYAVHDIALKQWETRMYVSLRTDVAHSPLEWLTLQRGWWQGTAAPPVRHLPTRIGMQRFSLDLTERWAYKNIAGHTDADAAALTKVDVDDSGWEHRTLDLWLTPGDKSAKRILLRRRFTVPTSWSDGSVYICADIPWREFMFDTRFFVDGIAWNGGREAVDGPYMETLNHLFKPGTSHVIALDIQSHSTLTGTMGPIWLYYLPEPKGRQDLAGTWSGYSDATHKIGEYLIPGPTHGQYLSRSVFIDSGHSASNVVVYYETPNDAFSIMVNGRLLQHGDQVREHIFIFNITPLITFGQENLIELVGNTSPVERTIAVIELRFYEKDVYP